MDTDLNPVVAALAELADDELHALIDATNGVPQTAPGLLAWIEGACDWELHCRAGLDYPLLPPEAAIPPEEDAVSIDAALAMRAMFAQDDCSEARAVVGLFDAIVGLLCRGDGKVHILGGVFIATGKRPVEGIHDDRRNRPDALHQGAQFRQQRVHVAGVEQA